jgi:PTH1 family peptidyl-tRNA hydrolase
MSAAIALIVGLGNPGQQYQATRHNAGAMFLDRLASAYKAELRPESKFKGLTGRIDVAGHEVRLLFPTTFMNKSGEAVQPIAQFYKLEPAQILIAYDELDLPLGTSRLKIGGGHGGHNGVRDIIRALGTADFARLRLGIGHPGDSSLVLNYVLGPFRKAEEPLIQEEFDKAVALMPLLTQGKMPEAMTRLHTTPKKPSDPGKASS